jgi:hypothetical protein
MSPGVAELVACAERRGMANELRQALQVVADYRHVELWSLGDAIEGYAEIGQARWVTWRRKLDMADSLPANFADALGALEVFAEPILTGSVELCILGSTRQTWSDGS